MYNLLETFFFISLGITFILISLLVYHFQQRIKAVEKNSDTMFDIMNNMVREMAQVKYSVFQATQSPPMIITTNKLPSNGTELVVVSDDEDEDEDEDDEDEDEDDEDDDEDNDEDNDDDSDDDDGHDDEDEPDKFNIGDAIELDVPLLELDDLYQPQVVEENNEVEICLESECPIPVSDVPIPMQSNDVITMKSDDVHTYSVKELRELVVVQGLISDPSKLKKNELVKMLKNQ